MDFKKLDAAAAAVLDNANYINAVAGNANLKYHLFCFELQAKTFFIPGSGLQMRREIKM